VSANVSENVYVQDHVKAERAAERRALFMQQQQQQQQQQRAGQLTAPSSTAGSVRAPESSSVDELRNRQAGIPAAAQRAPESNSMAELLGRQQVSLCISLNPATPRPHAATRRPATSARRAT